MTDRPDAPVAHEIDVTARDTQDLANIAYGDGVGEAVAEMVESDAAGVFDRPVRITGTLEVSYADE